MRVRIPLNPPMSKNSKKNRRNKKPNKRQQAILTILGIVESEGLHYGLVNYGGSEEVKIIDDADLTKLFNRFRETSVALETKLAELQAEVSAFMEDESEF
jgi:hypothetical protein